jgi:hypothetical protein
MESFVVGRKSSSGGVHIAIDPREDTVGRRHAELQVGADGSCLIRDLGSANGTFVYEGGRWSKVAEARISQNQQIRLGDYETTAARLLAMKSGSQAGGSGGYHPVVQAQPAVGAAPLPVYRASTFDPNPGGYGAHGGHQPSATESLAVWSLVLSLVGLLCTCGLTAIPAVICGHVAISKIGNPPRKSGKGMAIAGLVIGYIGVLLFLFSLVYFVFLGGIAALLGLVGLAAMGA